ncbi:DUF4236 domain-containing protein [Vibrio parahaemolyticus]|uniref:DUF4236 domain-containing protein n=1 Tax=Vibrio vulnificus TaxID=672 RepID=UPI000D726A6E|nr:DUF4236 domain-containing protein [Vibrio vulnificus]MDF5600800.1 DUF4236 domain-containing protein [Vibrio parahaemolyticus]PWY32239.1 DUF4236 domain-containing protein [Vibrio vulnificus]
MKGLRYQKRIKVLPFLWVNISKSNFSITVGNRFIKFNIGRRGLWFSGSLVGTGLSFRKKVPLNTNKDKA